MIELPLRKKIPSISPAVEQVVLTSLEKNPESRFENVREFARALEQASQFDAFLPEQAVRSDETSATILPLQKPVVPLLGSFKKPAIVPPSASIARSEPAGTVVCSYLGHLNTVQSLSWSPDGSRFACASNDMTVQVWDTTTNLNLLTFTHTAPVRVMAWSPDGKYMASGGGDTSILVWVAP